MKGITPPWPPDDYTQPLPFDQRGACWPWGPCSSSLRLELRYDIIGYRLDGPVGPSWGPMQGGQCLVPTPVWPITKTDYHLTGGVHGPPTPQDDLHFWLDTDGVWQARYDGYHEIVPFVFSYFHAEGPCSTTVCDDELILPVADPADPTSGPEFVSIKFVRWWMATRYPFTP